MNLLICRVYENSTSILPPTFVFIICQSSTSVEYELVVIKSGRLPFVPSVVLVVVTAIKSFIRTIEDSHLRCCATFRFHFKFCFHFPFSQLLLVRGPLSPPRDKTLIFNTVFDVDVVAAFSLLLLLCCCCCGCSATVAAVFVNSLSITLLWSLLSLIWYCICLQSLLLLCCCGCGCCCNDVIIICISCPPLSAACCCTCLFVDPPDHFELYC